MRMARIAEEEAFRWRSGEPERRYARFRATRHYGGNVAGDVSGCNLRCVFCWAWRTAFNARRGEFYTPRGAAERIMGAGPYRVARLTGGEPLIGWPHTRRVAEILLERGYEFVLETNGILLGSGDVEASSVPRGVHVRVSLKAPSRELFERVTGTYGWGLDLQLRALEELLSAGFLPGRDFHAAIVVGLAEPQAYSRLLERLYSISSVLVETLEEEVIVLYPHVKRLLEKRGFKPLLTWDPRVGRLVRLGGGDT